MSIKYFPTILTHTFVKKSVNSSAQGMLFSVTGVSISIHIQCPEVNLPTVQLFFPHNAARQKPNSSRANTQSTKPVICQQKKKKKGKPKQSQTSDRKQHSLSLRLCRIRNVISLIYQYFYTFLRQNKHLHLSRDLGLSEYTNTFFRKREISCYTQSDARTPLLQPIIVHGKTLFT